MGFNYDYILNWISDVSCHVTSTEPTHQLEQVNDSRVYFIGKFISYLERKRVILSTKPNAFY